MVALMRGNLTGKIEEETLDCEHGKCRFISCFASKYHGRNAKCRLANGYDLRNFPNTKVALC